MLWYDVNEEEKSNKKHFKLAKETIRNANGIEPTDEQVYGVLHFMRRLAQMNLEITNRQHEWKLRLREFPKGFAVEKGGNCQICGKQTALKDSWYDKHGLKCLPCQKALDMKMIPYSVIGKKDRYYTDFDLKRYFNLEGKMLGEWIKNGIINARTVPHLDGKGKYFRMFLLSENKDFLPPMKMLDIGGYETFLVNGQETEVYIHWYQVKDPFVYLKKYGIMQYMKRTELAELAEEKPVEKVPEVKVNYCAPCSYPAVSAKSVQVKKRKARRK